jgi:hypothetical protein
MTWFATAMVIYIVIDRLLTVAWIGRQIDITPGFAVTSLLTGALWVWGVLALAGVA